MTDLRYPIGRFQPSATFTAETRRRALDALAALPADLRAAVAGLDDRQLDTPYRDGGWTVRQLVHHVPDSHLNAYVRHRLCVTEENPGVRGYDQDAWVRTPEVAAGDVALPLSLLAALHARWTAFLTALPASAFARTFVHGETGRIWSLDESVEMYAWHGRHHVAHVTTLRARMGW
jgi:hypothetical protein